MFYIFTSENITFSKYAFYFINNSLYFITLYIIKIKMPHLLLIFSQLDYLTQVVDTKSLNSKQCRSRSVGFFRSGSTLFAKQGLSRFSRTRVKENMTLCHTSWQWNIDSLLQSSSQGLIKIPGEICSCQNHHNLRGIFPFTSSSHTWETRRNKIETILLRFMSHLHYKRESCHSCM